MHPAIPVSPNPGSPIVTVPNLGLCYCRGPPALGKCQAIWTFVVEGRCSKQKCCRSWSKSTHINSLVKFFFFTLLDMRVPLLQVFVDTHFKSKPHLKMHLTTYGFRFHWLSFVHASSGRPSATPRGYTQLSPDSNYHTSTFWRCQDALTNFTISQGANVMWFRGVGASPQTRCKLFKVLTSASRIAPPNNFNALPKTAWPRRIWGTQSKIITTNPVPSAKSRLAQHDETSPGFQYIEISAATWERLIPYECLADMAEVWRLYCFLKKKMGIFGC